MTPEQTEELLAIAMRACPDAMVTGGWLNYPSLGRCFVVMFAWMDGRTATMTLPEQLAELAPSWEAMRRAFTGNLASIATVAWRGA